MKVTELEKDALHGIYHHDMPGLNKRVGYIREGEILDKMVRKGLLSPEMRLTKNGLEIIGI